MERWCVKCPHCGEYHDIDFFKNIRYESEETMVQGKAQYKVKNILYLCSGCACTSTEAEIKRQPAKWIAENPDAYQRGVRSFWLNSFVSPWASWESTILEYLYAQGDTAKMQVGYNTRFGQLWENRGDTQDPETMLKRREAYDAELPEGVLVLTAGVDTQDDRFEYEIVGHGHFGETWGIEKGIIMGSPDDPATWDSLDMMVFDRVLRFKDGLGLKVSMSFVDEGGHFTAQVRKYCRDRIRKKAFCIKGVSGPDRPFTAPPKKMKIVVGNRYLGACWQYQLGVDEGKQKIMDRLRVEAHGPKYCHFPLRDDYGLAYFNGLLSEHLVPEGKTRQRWVWAKIPGHERNEPLDCRNYALAAFEVLPVNLDAKDRQLKKARGIAVDSLVQPASEPAPPKSKKKDALDRYYDEW